MRGAIVLGLFLAVGALASAAAAQSNLAAAQDVTGPQAALARLASLSERAALNSPEGRALFAGEMTQLNRATLGAIPAADRILILAGGTAVARLPAEGETRPDLYVYFAQGSDGSWRIAAWRSLALMGVPTELRRQLRALPRRDTEQDWTLANLDLTLASDTRLRAWFSENRATLERLRQMAQPARPVENGSEARVDHEEARNAVRSLHALMVTVSQNGVVRITLGGILDNEVGILHAPTAAAAPPIVPGSYIWVEPLGDGWYLYKTT